MRCVVFGATGYLGSRSVAELLSAGHDEQVKARTPAKLHDVPCRSRFDVVEGGVTEPDQVRQSRRHPLSGGIARDIARGVAQLTYAAAADSAAVGVAEWAVHSDA